MERKRPRSPARGAPGARDAPVVHGRGSLIPVRSRVSLLSVWALPSQHFSALAKHRDFVEVIDQLRFEKSLAGCLSDLGQSAFPPYVFFLGLRAW